MDLNWLILIVNTILAVITGWYAWSTQQMLKAMNAQLESAKIQSSIMQKSVQVTALAALINAQSHPEGGNPIPKLRKLVAELELLDNSNQQCGSA